MTTVSVDPRASAMHVGKQPEAYYKMVVRGDSTLFQWKTVMDSLTLLCVEKQFSQRMLEKIAFSHRSPRVCVLDYLSQPCRICIYAEPYVDSEVCKAIKSPLDEGDDKRTGF